LRDMGETATLRIGCSTAMRRSGVEWPPSGVACPAKEIVFSVDCAGKECATREFYTATVCRDGNAWKWATTWRPFQPRIKRMCYNRTVYRNSEGWVGRVINKEELD
jgi:hypothetical protein